MAPHKSQIIEWKYKPFADGWDEVPADVVVWVDIAKVEKSWRTNDKYVGPNGSGDAIARRYEGVGKDIKSRRPIFMIEIGLNDQDEISFTDGRHRFAWLRDHGVEALPVQTSPLIKEVITERFGSAMRSSILPGTV